MFWCCLTCFLSYKWRCSWVNQTMRHTKTCKGLLQVAGFGTFGLCVIFGRSNMSPFQRLLLKSYLIGIYIYLNIVVHHERSMYVCIQSSDVFVCVLSRRQPKILQLFCSYQEAIEDITMRMGAGMAKFICKEVNLIIILQQ